MNDQQTALALGQLVIEFRNIILKSLPPKHGVVDFSINTMFNPSFDGVSIDFSVNATIVNVDTGELSVLDGEISGKAELGEKK